MTVGIYYATTTGKTEDVADRLHNYISSAESPKDVSDVDDLSEFEGLMELFVVFLHGIPEQMRKDLELLGIQY